MSRLVIAAVLCALVGAAGLASALPMRAAKVGALSADDLAANRLNEENADLAALAHDAGIEFAEPSAAFQPHPPPQSARRPNPPPFAASADGQVTAGADAADAAAAQPQAQEELVTGLGKSLRFRMHNAAELVSIVEHAQRVGMNVDAAQHVIAQLGHATAWNKHGLDARQQLQAGKRKALVSAVKSACSAAWDKISMKASLSIAGSFAMGADVSKVASFGASGKVEMKITGTVSIECSDVKVCSKCLWNAMLMVVVPGYGMFKNVGADTFAQPTACEPQLFGWCTSFVHRWICDNEVLEGMAVNDETTVNDPTLLSACEAETVDASSDTTKAYSKRRCQDFERFLRPLRPDLMRYLKCDMVRGWTKGWRKFAEFGRGMVGRLVPVPYLRQYALKKLDDRHSRYAAASTFSCPLTAHDQAHQACAYYLPLLDIPALATCEGDPKATTVAEMQKASLKTEYKKENPNAVMKTDDTTGGRVDGKVDGAACFNEAFDYARKNIVPPSTWQKTATPFANTLLAGYTDKAACKSLNALVAAVPETRLTKWLKPQCTAPAYANVLGVCESQALVCAAVLKTNAANNYWRAIGRKKAWYAGGLVGRPQRISVKAMCDSLETIAPGLAHRCRRFKSVNREQLPYLMLGMGCKMPAHSAKTETEQGTGRDDVICSAPAEDVDEQVLNNAYRACLEARTDLQLPVLAQCGADGLAGQLPKYTDNGFDWNVALGTALDHLMALDGGKAKRRLEASKFYRVLAAGTTHANAASAANGGQNKKISEWVLDDLNAKPGVDVRWSTVDSEAKMCVYVAQQALTANVGNPCNDEIDASDPNDVQRQTWCKDVREMLYQMTRVGLGKWKGVHNSFTDNVMAFVVRHRETVTVDAPTGFKSFLQAPQWLCKQLPLFQTWHYTKSADQTKAAPYGAGANPAAPNLATDAPECGYCQTYLMRLASDDTKSHAPRSEAVEYYVEARYKHFWPRLAAARGGPKAKTSYKAVDEALAAAIKTDAQLTGDALGANGAQVCSILADTTDSPVFTTKPADKKKAKGVWPDLTADCALVGTAAHNLLKAAPNTAARIKGECQILLPQCKSGGFWK